MARHDDPDTRFNGFSESKMKVSSVVSDYSSSRKARIPFFMSWLFVVVGATALISPNPLLGIFGVSVAYFLTYLLWREGEPQIFLFIVGFQWLQVFAVILQGLLSGKSISEEMGGSVFETSTLLSFIGIGVLGLGIKFSTRRALALDLDTMRNALNSLRMERIFIAWIVLSLALLVANKLGGLIPGFQQALISLDVWKWAAILLLFIKWLDSGKGRAYVGIVLSYEVFLGMLGYFSAFKEVFFILLIAGSAIVALGRERILLLLGIGFALLAFIGFWQAIKGDYRKFLSQGERTQAVQVSVSDRVIWLVEAIPKVSFQKVNDGIEAGVKRLGYVRYFGHAMRTVPVRVSHTNGKLWKEAVMHPLMPRMFFPDKAEINDSDRTNTYTGLLVADASEGTSISIGYMGESYIDFGKLGMFIPVLVWGFILGKCYHWLRDRSVNPLLGVALGSSLLLSSALLLEASNIKMTGSLAAAFITTTVLNYFFGSRLWSLLSLERNRVAK